MLWLIKFNKNMKNSFFYFSKNKYYDGSSTLKMIGQDCLQFESNIEKFVHVFFERGGSQLEIGALKKWDRSLHYILCFETWLTSDIRAVTVDMQRISSFLERAKKFFKTFKRYSSVLVRSLIFTFWESIYQSSWSFGHR